MGHGSNGEIRLQGFAATGTSSVRLSLPQRNSKF